MLLCMSRALDGDLTAHKKAELSAHLAGCAPCRARALDMNAADELFRELANNCGSGHFDKLRTGFSRDDAPAFADQVMQRIRLEKAPAGGIQEFSRLVAQDQVLQDQLRPASSPDAFVGLFVSLGQQRGYRFDSGEVVSLLSARKAANDDLSDEQLEAMVGGVSTSDTALYAFIDELFPNGFK